jgi:hypothetical protein
VHTNPILLTFVSILYYQDLGEHIKMHKLEKHRLNKELKTNDEYLKMKTFTGSQYIFNNDVIESNNNQSSGGQFNLKKIEKKSFRNKTIINKWHLILMLCRNKSLIKYRKIHIKPNIEKKKSEGSLLKLKKNISSCCRKCCAKKGTT